MVVNMGCAHVITSHTNVVLSHTLKYGTTQFLIDMWKSGNIELHLLSFNDIEPHIFSNW